MEMELSSQILSDITVHMKYSRYDERKHRRELWKEIVYRNAQMHIDKFPKLKKEILDAYENYVLTKKVLPSMRALENNTPIRTVNGWKIVKDISIGDILFDSNGNETKVLDIAKFNNKDLYKITFSDKSELIACNEHLWIVYTQDDIKYKKESRVVSTEYLLKHYKRNGRNNLLIKNPKPIKLSHKQLKINPYILGLWLGDGYSNGIQYSSSVNDSKFLLNEFKNCGYDSKQSESSNIWTWSIYGLKDDLQEYNLVNNKYIPINYLNGSIEQRLSLLQGLMDSDGTIDKNGRCFFTNGNVNIINGVKELLSSLGIKYTVGHNKKKKEHHLILYNIRFTTNMNVFRLPRKLDRIRKDNLKQTENRKIINIEYIGKGNATCFHVDSPDSSFLAGKNLIITHNSIQFAGKPIKINPARIYNCAYLPIDDWRAFSETMFLLLGGTGVGYSVQRHHVENLPEIYKPKRKKRYLVGDSIEGWADAIKVLMKAYLSNGALPMFDFSDIRPKGARLITAGGKAPGPEPLKECLSSIKILLDKKTDGSKLTPFEAHLLVCLIADAVLAGGIRRAALIALFSFDDDEMLACKSSTIKVDKLISAEHPKYTDKDGLKSDTNKLVLNFIQNGIEYKDIIIYKDEKSGLFHDMEQYKTDGTFGWWVANPQLGRANNSAVALRHRINKRDFNSLWKKIKESGSGEPGIYFSNDMEWGTNPCVEIALRAFQFCNLVEINGNDVENQEDFDNRVRVASFIATLQASYTEFHYLRDIWQKTTEKDALLGVGITGIGGGKLDNINLTKGAEIVKEENKRVAKLIGIKVANRTTCVKPSGTSSLVLGTSSGIHAWFDEYYIRRIRVGKNEAIYSYLEKYHSELIEDDAFKPDIQAVISVPQKAPYGAILRNNETALTLLERVKRFNVDWVRAGHINGHNTHNVSCTVSIKDNEWDEVGKWMWDNRDTFNGLSILPYNGGSYKQAPFESISKTKYYDTMKILHEIDLSKVVEGSDETDLKGEIACGGGACEV